MPLEQFAPFDFQVHAAVTVVSAIDDALGAVYSSEGFDPHPAARRKPAIEKKPVVLNQIRLQ
jgi:hypothetical protein